MWTPNFLELLHGEKMTVLSLNYQPTLCSIIFTLYIYIYIYIYICIEYHYHYVYAITTVLSHTTVLLWGKVKGTRAVGWKTKSKDGARLRGSNDNWWDQHKQRHQNFPIGCSHIWLGNFSHHPLQRRPCGVPRKAEKPKPVVTELEIHTQLYHVFWPISPEQSDDPDSQPQPEPVQYDTMLIPRNQPKHALWAELDAWIGKYQHLCPLGDILDDLLAEPSKYWVDKSC